MALPAGVKVDWLAAGTYDRSVGLSLFTLQITHKIAENIDAERDHVLASLQQSATDVEVRVIRDFSTGYHARNGGGDSISTDGDLPVVDLTRLRPQPGTVVPAATDRRHRRPAPTLFGGVLVVLRGLAALALAVGLLAGSPAVAAEIDADALLPPVAVVLAVFGITEIMLAWFILRGGNRSRLAAMALSSAAIVTQWIAVLNGGPGVTFATNLVGLSLDILLIIALSSQRSRDFARQSGQHPATPAKAPRTGVPGTRS